MIHPSLRCLVGSLIFWATLVVAGLLAGQDSTDGHFEGTALASVGELSANRHSSGLLILDKSLPLLESASVGKQNLPAPETIIPRPPQEDAGPRHRIYGQLRDGESLDMALKRHGIMPSMRGRLIKALGGSLDFRRLHPGDQFVMELASDNELTNFTFQSGPLDIYSVVDSEEGLLASREPVHLECRITMLSATIDSSLFAAFTDLGEQARIVYAFADIFASKIDFNTESRQRDRFSLVVEKYYKDDIFVRYGRILAASYETSNRNYQAYYFSSGKTAGYFDGDGKEVGTSFIRSPIPFSRVSSKFSLQRKHPILGVTRPHLGVDLAAPRGTPVMASSDGKVVFVGRNGGYGKQIIINHGNGYRTHYGHLSSFKKGLAVGSIIRQKDTIGYVGSTGLATGPHLDYRIEQNGEFKNPFDLKFKPKHVLAGEEFDLFAERTRKFVGIMLDPDEQRVLQVKKVTIPSPESPYLL